MQYGAVRSGLTHGRGSVRSGWKMWQQLQGSTCNCCGSSFLVFCQPTEGRQRMVARVRDVPARLVAVVYLGSLVEEQLKAPHVPSRSRELERRSPALQWQPQERRQRGEHGGESARSTVSG